MNTGGRCITMAQAFGLERSDEITQICQSYGVDTSEILEIFNKSEEPPMYDIKLKIKGLHTNNGIDFQDRMYTLLKVDHEHLGNYGVCLKYVDSVSGRTVNMGQIPRNEACAISDKIERLKVQLHDIEAAVASLILIEKMEVTTQFNFKVGILASRRAYESTDMGIRDALRKLEKLFGERMENGGATQSDRDISV